MNGAVSRSAVTLILFLVWGLSIAVGFHQVIKYENTPGKAAKSQADWPTASRIVPVAERYNLVMVAHPRCPCTRASLEELRKLISCHPSKLAAHLLFLMPAGVGPEWEHSELRRTAESIRGLTVRTDEEGAEAARFGGLTSGHVVVYDPSGKQVFSGGLTSGRGRAGESVGVVTIDRLLNGASNLPMHAPVFGCPLFNTEKCHPKEPE